MLPVVPAVVPQALLVPPYLVHLSHHLVYQALEQLELVALPSAADRSLQDDRSADERRSEAWAPRAVVVLAAQGTVPWV